MAKSDPTVVVGGGFGGTSLLLHLMEHTDRDVVLVDPAARPGAGPAYRTVNPRHLLNSRSSAMSVDACDPGHFATWLGSRGPYTGSFAPRMEYGAYLFETLERVLKAAGPRARVVTGSVVDVEPRDGHVSLTLDDGGRLRASHVILALGNPRSSGPGGVDDPRYVRDPWAPGALDLDADRVLLIGTGLTAVDAALSLADRVGRITAVSGHGLLPLRHRETTGTPTTATPPLPTTLRDAIREVRRRCAPPNDWREVVDALRHRVDETWAAWPDEDRERFIAHCSRHWEVHRHRMAPGVADTIDALTRSGTVSVRADRVASVDAGTPLTVRLRSGGTEEVDAVVDCTGPASLPSGASPLVRRLLDTGVVRINRFRFGLDVADDGSALTADGRHHPRISVIGALRRGCRWETTAVPEIRAQAYATAAGLAETG